VIVFRVFRARARFPRKEAKDAKLGQVAVLQRGDKGGFSDSQNLPLPLFYKEG